VRAALYLRVSTKRQAEQELSIPDQRKQLEAHCRKHGWTVAAVYEEAGASATTDNRPVFQDMVAATRQRPCPFDVILVHSFSRFARDAYQLEFHIRDFRKRSVRVASLTQETGDDPMGQMVRQIFAIFDEYQSKENAKHTLRAMKENARQGYWNGAAPPFGYSTVAAETRGEKVKKRLALDPKEAELVREAFHLYLTGNGTTGPLGIKEIAKHLNAAGYRQRQGRRFNNKFVHELLRETAYAGTYYFNRFNSRTRQRKPEAEWVPLACPAIVERAIFDAVQRQMTERNPRRTPGRRVNNPILLSGMVKCARCGGTMSLRTGKGGRYRYYACLRQAKEGRDGCRGCSVPMGVLDSAVTEALIGRVVAPERMAALLREAQAEAGKARDSVSDQRAALEARRREAEAKLDRLYDALERGLVDQDETFKSRVGAAKAEWDEIVRLMAQGERRIVLPLAAITPKKLDAFSKGLADMLRTGNIQFRKAYLRLFVDRVEMLEDGVRISGSKNALIAAAAAGIDPKAGVPTLVQEWRPHGDSNPGCRRERGINGALADTLKQTDPALIRHFSL
jgi:DNA invertase Pin-like site-specific DNA recombinase